MHLMIGTMVISLCAADRRTLMVDAMVEEQDTSLLLGTHPVVRDTQESYPALVRKMGQQKPLLPGMVIIKNTIPLRLTAIVYDIEQIPVCTEELIATVLNNLLDKFHEYKLKSVSIPLLGCAHGKIKASVFIKLLHNTLASRNPVYPAEMVLIVPADTVDDIRDIIENIISNSKTL